MEQKSKYWVIVSWGYPFRFGFFEINRHDFELISSQMPQKDYA